MPVGMLLRSSWRASSIANPGRDLTLDAYERELGKTLPRRLPLDDFIAYAHWFRGRVVPDSDSRKVTRLETASGGFTLRLEDGEALRARRVSSRRGLPRSLTSPSSSRTCPPSSRRTRRRSATFTPSAGKRVVVVGGGQSALEDTALLHEAGAEVELVARTPAIRWLEPDLPEGTPALRRFLYQVAHPPTDVGPPGLNWIAGAPDVFRRMPRTTQPEIGVRCIRPAASFWLKHRVADVPLTTGRSVVSAAPASDGLQLTLDDGSRREIDHVVLATGYRIDIAKYGFLGRSSLRSIRLVNGYPALTTGLESCDEPGLHFMGATAATTFGPVMRFITGSWYCAPALTRRLTESRRLPALVRLVLSGFY